MSGTLISSERVSQAIGNASTLVDLLRQRALSQPDHTAYTFLGDGEKKESTLTYSELDRDARAIGAYLQASGAEGERVILLYQPGIEYIAAFFGCLYAGAVAVPAYPPKPGRYLDRLRSVMVDSKAAVALTTEQALSKLKPRLGRTSEFDHIRWATNENHPPEIAEEWRAPEISPETLAFLQYTSGSTAQPKGVMVSHANLLHNESVIHRMFGQTEDSVIVGWLPLYHDMGLIGNVIQPLYLGARCILMSPVSFLQKPLRWLRTITDYGATTSGGPNFAYDLCLRKIGPEERETLDLSAWAVAFNGAEPIRAETMERFAEYFAPCGFRRDAFHPCYGLAEATLAVTGKLSGPPIIKTVAPTALGHWRVVEAGEEGSSLVSCGGGPSDQAVVIVDPVSGLRRPPDEVGEIWVSGPSVAQGYWNRPAETEETFRAYLLDNGDGPFLRTGDLGFQQDGELFVTGRLKDLIIIRGRNYYPQDIERTVEECNAALRPGCGAAFSVEAGGEERLVVVQEVDRHQENLDDLIGVIVQAVVGDHEIQPHAVVLLKTGSIPKTSSGKIQRRACRKGFLDQTLSSVAEWRFDPVGNHIPAPGLAPAGETPAAERNPEWLSEAGAIEAWLRSLIAGRLQVNEPSLDTRQSLTRFGLDSLGAVELAYEIESTAGVSVSPHHLLDGSSLTQLAARIAASQGQKRTDPSDRDSSSEPSGEYPLSYGQQALWFLYRMSPESPAYNLSAALRILSPLDVSRLRNALQGLVDRHPMLRTTFTMRDGEPVQRVSNLGEICFEQSDAGTWTETELNIRLGEETRRPFKLEEAPPLRVRLFMGCEGGPVLLVTVHHLVADLRSIFVALRELGALYSAAQPQVALQGAGLAAPSSYYTDYIQEQRRRIEGPYGERLWSYWQKECAGELPLLEMPTDRPRPPFQSYNGAAHAFTMDAALKEGLKSIARRYEATLFMVLHAAFDLLLYRHTGQEDLMVGSPAAGRNQPQLAELVGYFVNPILIRSNLSGAPRFSELLHRVKRSIIGALEHQDYPFSLLVDRVQPVRDPGRTPLFQTMFVLQPASPSETAGLTALAVNHPGVRITLGDLNLESVALEKRIAQFDLALIMAETEEGLVGSLEYNADLFEAATVNRLAAHYRRLLESLIANPEARIAEMPMISAEESRQVLVEWNQTAAPFPAGLCIHDLFLEQVAAQPEAVALVCGEEALSYAELNRRANQVARHLRDLGIGPESLVGLMVERSVRMVVGMLGVLKAGGGYLPLDPAYPQERLDFMLQDAPVKALLTEQRWLATIPPAVAGIICLDSEWESIARQSDADVAGMATPSNLAYLIYTSGSTGTPKAVMVEHCGLINLVSWHQREYAISSLDRATQVAAMSFDASVWEIWPYLTIGASLHVAHSEVVMAAGELLKWMGQQMITISFLPTPVAEEVIRRQWPDGMAVRAILTGGDRLRRVREESRGWKLINHYGPTETTVVATAGEVRQEAQSWREPSIGRPISNTQAYILSNELEPTPVGVDGELYIGGVGLARGYLGRPDLTAERFTPHPFTPEEGRRLYRTGDVARYLKNGEIDYRGRADHQVKIRGYRIELGEIETVMEEHESVRQCAVVVREETGEKSLVAYVVGRAEEEEERGLRAYLRRRLPDYMRPEAIVRVSEIPLTPNGKVDRKRLPLPTRREYGGGREVSGPRTETERQVVEIFKEMLGVNEIGTQDGFFELGGHSLRATKLLSRIQDEWGVALPLRKVFEFPTVEGLAGVIAETVAGRHLDEGPRKVGRGAPLPLSFAQQRMWFLHQLKPEAGVYNIAGGVRLRGELREEALRRALNGVTQRHEALRTRYEVGDGGPAQVIDDHGTIELRVIILEGEESPERKFDAIAKDEAERGFDLERGPVMRLALVRMSKDEHVLLVTAHHIAADGWSLGVFIEEVGALYTSEVERERGENGGCRPLKELKIQYADYAVWQRERLEGERSEEELRYWREHLAGAPRALDLPTDRARPAAQSYRGGREKIEIGGEVKGELEAIGRETGATLFMALIAGLRILLWRYSGQEDVLIGTPIANRERAETQGLIGFFVNTLALRTELNGDLNFRELVKRERDTALGAFAHQELPFERLVEELSSRRDVGRSPLFQVMFVLQDALRQGPEMPDLETELISIDNGTSKFDLTVMMEEREERLFASMEYNLDLFEAETIDRMLGHFRVLLRACAARPDQRLAELPLLTDAERRQITEEWNGTGREYSSGLCLHEWFEVQAARGPDAIAVVFENEQISYRELNSRANQLARYLRSGGVGPEVIVAALMERSVEMVMGLLGILKAGGAYLPLAADYPQERLNFMARDARASFLLTQERLIDKAPSELEIICLDRDFELFGGEDRSNRQSGVRPENLAYVIYTSGSTGVPKAAMNTHLGICNHLLWTQETYRLTSDDRVLQKTPFSFDVSVWELFWTLIAGAPLVMAQPGGHRKSEYLVETIKRERITTLHFVPSMLQNFLDGGEASGCDSVRRVICSGEALPLDLPERFFRQVDAELHNLYGPTEAAVHVTSWACECGSQRRSVPIGRPIANIECYLLDRGMELTPVGVAGELHLGGVGLARGYLGRPELTAEKFIPHPFSNRPGARLYRTGDLTRYLAEGEIEYLGRIDHQVKVRGFRIELGEIEAVLTIHPQVREAVVMAREAAFGDRRLAAYLVTDQPPPSSAELREFLKGRLPEFMIPSAFTFLEALPLSPNGKTDRRSLPEPQFIQRAEETRTAPLDELERAVADVWQEVLQVEKIGRDDSFFDLGGHSLLMTQVHRRLRERLKSNLSLVDLFKYSTVVSLAQHLKDDVMRPRPERDNAESEQMAGGQNLMTEAIPRQGANDQAPLSFAQLRLWFQEELAPGTGFFNLPAAIQLKGGLDVATLEQSLSEIIRRHEVLRTRFSNSTEVALQIIDPPATLSLSVVDLSGLTASSRQSEARRLAAEQAERPFDLGRGPLVRGALLKLSHDEHALLWTMHHIVSDAYSLGVLTREMTECYRAFLNGKPSPLPELPIQYADFARWQRAWLAGEVFESQLSYWKKQLAGSPPLLKLPTDRPRPPVQSTRGAALPFELPPSLVESLRTLSKRERVTLFMILLAAFNMLLRRYTGQEDIVLGADIANRNRRELEGLIGFFVNMLVIRTDLSGNPSFLDLLGRVQRVTVEAYAHQDLPFERLVEKLQPERNPGYSPLFQVVLNYYQAPADGLELPGLTLTDVSLESQISRFDLSLFISDRGGRVSGHWRYSTALFDAATIVLMHDRFEALLHRIAAQPDARLNTLEILTETEKRRRAEKHRRLKTSNFEKFKQIRPKAIDQSGSGLVRLESSPGAEALPLVIRPEMEDVDLADWARNNLDLIEARLLEHGAILLRDFRIESVEGFERFAKIFDPQLLDYTEPSSPRSEVRQNIYTSTEYPASQWIRLHNEMSYLGVWPHKLFFFCLQPASHGGATPLAFSRAVFELIDPKIRRRFIEKRVMYVRNFGDGLDLSWQRVFKTEERSEVERHCRAAAIDFEWVGEDHLRTRQVHQAVIRHPRTKDIVWFNQAHAFHSSSLEPAVRESLLAEKRDQDLPRNAYYGDGTPIEDSVIAEILEAYRTAAVTFDWQRGDLLVAENMLVAHGRAPFSGARKVLVAMSGLINSKDVEVIC